MVKTIQTRAYRIIGIDSAVGNGKPKMKMSDTNWKLISHYHENTSEESSLEICGGSLGFGDLSFCPLALYYRQTQTSLVPHNSWVFSRQQ
jgi:hypothetical protein